MAVFLLVAGKHAWVVSRCSSGFQFAQTLTHQCHEGLDVGNARAKTCSTRAAHSLGGMGVVLRVAPCAHPPADIRSRMVSCHIWGNGGVRGNLQLDTIQTIVIVNGAESL